MKKIILLTGLIMVIIVSISAIVNIKNQFLTLNMAKSENMSLEKKIRDLETLNNKLSRRIEYATTSAFIDQKMRENFGLGTENDVWLELSPETKIDLNMDKEKIIEKPNYRKWLDLFTS